MWIAGGAFVAHSAWQSWQIGRMANTLEAMARDLDPEAGAGQPLPEDTGRDPWVAVGGVLTFLSGCSLLAASRFALPFCVVLCAHQLLYFARQAHRLRAARDDEAAVAPSARNAAVLAIGVSACAVYLTMSGAYG